MEAEELAEYSLSNYGIRMTLEQAEEFREKFFSAYPGISQWHEDVELHSYNETRTLGNRKRLWCFIYHINGVAFFKAPIQGTVADILKKALCILHERIDGTGIKIIGCIHSEIITEAPVAKIDTAAETLRESMINAGKMYLKDVPVVVDVSVGDNWYQK
jgi:DNA polymerase-1